MFNKFLEWLSDDNSVTVDFDNIDHVIVLETIQNWRRGSTKGGFIFGSGGPNWMVTEGDMEPAGVTYVFSITYKDGRQEIVRAESGTGSCARLLQKAYEADATAKEEITERKKAPILQKNQLPQGEYLIGKDIPPGIYDFHHVWGSGSLVLYSEPDDPPGWLEFQEFIDDNEFSGFKKDCLHVNCKDGWLLRVDGNLVVEIAEPQKIEIDLKVHADEEPPADEEPADDEPKAKRTDKAPALQKNQLPNGTYRIGKDIPPGIYDFHHVWGDGSLEIYSEPDDSPGFVEYSEFVDDGDFGTPDCIHVDCKEGWELRIEGNLIVEIAKPQAVQIDL